MQMETIKKVIEAEKLAEEKIAEAKQTAISIKQNGKKTKQKEWLAMEERVAKEKQKLQESSELENSQSVQSILEQAQIQCDEIETLSNSKKTEAIAVVLKKVVE